MRLALPLLAISLLAACANQPAGTAGPTVSYETAHQTYEHGDMRLAMQQLGPLASSGDSRAERDLGMIYLSGGAGGNPNDFNQGVELLRKAATGGDPEAQYEYARFYEQDTASGAQIAHEWYQKSADQGWPAAEVEIGKDFLLGLTGYVNDASALEWFNKAAAAGDPAGLYYLGFMYLNGSGVMLDHRHGIELTQEAAQKGDREANLYFALCYRSGQCGFAVDANLSEQYFQHASDGVVQTFGELADAMKEIIDAHKVYPKVSVLGGQTGVALVEFDCPLSKPEHIEVTKSAGFPPLDAAAVQAVRESYFPVRAPRLNGMRHFKVAINFMLGSPLMPVPTAVSHAPPTPNSYAGTPAPSADTSLLAVQAEAAKGDSEAELHLGQRYFSGVGVPKDYVTAADWFRKAAIQGNVPSQSNLCYLYSVNRELPADYPQAFGWCRKAADAGDKLGESLLGRAYYQGLGVQRDYAQALLWLTKAAQQEDANSEMMLGELDLNGRAGKRDFVAARDWFEKSARQSDDDAAFELSRMYAIGLGGPKDTAHAFALIQGLAERHYPGAEETLGEYYETGENVGKDTIQADLWERRAADAGYGLAKTHLAVRHFSGSYTVVTDDQAVDWLDHCDDGDSECLNAAAWFFATTSRSNFRDPVKAEAFARKALLWVPDDSNVLDTLAAAYAAQGKYREAVEQQQKALGLVTDAATRASMQKRLALYQSGHAYIDKGDGQ